MSDEHCLEHLLLSLQAEGTADSSGVITLSPSRSLETAAESQLPFPEAWAVKVVQAAITEMKDREDPDLGLTVKLFLTSSFWEWPGQSWDPEQFEQAFLDYRPSGDEALDHLILGLWQAGLKQKRAFQVQFPGSSQLVLWDGQRLTRLACPKLSVFRLRVGQRLLPGPKSLLERLPGIEAARRNAEISQALRQLAFVSPRPIRLDNLRLDGFQTGPKNLWGAPSSILYTCFPLEVADLPALRVGTGCFHSHSFDHKESGIHWPFWWEAGLESLRQMAQPQILVLLGTSAGTAFGKEPALAQDWNCRLVWVHRGVVVMDEEIAMAAGKLRFVAFASAEGLATDLSSLGLIWNEDFQVRRERVLQALSNWLQAISRDVSTNELAAGQRNLLKGTGKTLCTICLPMGGFFFAVAAWGVFVPLALFSTVAGMFGVSDYLAAPEKAEQIAQGLRELKERWENRR